MKKKVSRFAFVYFFTFIILFVTSVAIIKFYQFVLETICVEYAFVLASGSLFIALWETLFNEI